MAHGDELVVDNVYSWVELGQVFGFKPAWLSAMGGMGPRPEQNALLLITHPGGGRSFDYSDHWDDETGDLIYTGRGQEGDQVLDGANRHLAENRFRNFLFEGAGTRRLRFRGKAVCKDVTWARGPDRDGLDRRILQFRLGIERNATPTEAAITVAKFFGGGESDAHKALKARVARNPGLAGLPPESVPFIEHRFQSPDRVDLLFRVPDGRVVAVEIELEGLANTVCGTWQAAKYRTLVALQEGWDIGDGRGQGVLVAHSVPEGTRQLCDRYGIQWFEVPRD